MYFQISEWEHLDLRGRKQEENGDNYVMKSFIICAFRKYYISVNKYRGVRGTRHVAHKREIRNIYRIFVQKPKRIDRVLRGQFHERFFFIKLVPAWLMETKVIIQVTFIVYT
jgi:hypothetical protein